MKTVKLACALLLASGCSSEPVEKPAEVPPPPWGLPVSGGTMTVTSGNHAVIADPDRDRLLSVDLATNEVVQEMALSGADEPGRVIEDTAGRLHVALRRGGALLTFADAASLRVVASRPVCAEPRGIAYDAATDSVHVACTTGELVTLPAAGGDATRTLRLDRDLRDVVVAGDQLIVTRFRTSDVLTIDATGTVKSRVRSPDRMRVGGFFGEPDPGGGAGSGGLVPAIAAVAWRAIPTTDGRVLVSHQRQILTTLGTKQPGGYGGGCGGNVEAAYSIVTPGSGTTPTTIRSIAPLGIGTLPVDVAIDPTGARIAVVLAGAQEINILRTAAFDKDDEDDCPQHPHDDDVAPTLRMGLGTPTSVAWTPSGELVVFYPELPGLVKWSPTTGTHTIRLPGDIGYDAGRNMFHQQTFAGLACASCHPEGRDDGLVWTFDTFGMRRTQSLAGGILQRAPYHWGGDMTDLDMLMVDVFGNRMGGEVTRSQRLSLGPWLDRLPAPAGVVVDADAAARGAVLFQSEAVGCAGCHNGPLLTNNAIVDVGTGGRIKVPSLLGVANRAPFMHSGCAATLAARFEPACGGGDIHGKTSHLTAAEISDLVAYLESL